MNLSAEKNDAQTASKSIKVLGTLVEIRLRAANSSLFPKCFSELERIEKTYSRFLENSLLSKINTELGTWHSVPSEFVQLLLLARAFYYTSEGNFDNTLKSALDNLGYDKN